MPILSGHKCVQVDTDHGHGCRRRPLLKRMWSDLSRETSCSLEFPISHLSGIVGVLNICFDEHL